MTEQNNQDVLLRQLEEKQTKLFNEMGKHPEREQELAQEYFTIDRQIINICKRRNDD